jgi:hypothetical protein
MKARWRLGVLVLLVSALAMVRCATGTHGSGGPHASAHRHPSSHSGGDQCPSWSDTISDAQVAVIRDVMSNRFHRLHHALWHAARGGLTPRENHQLVNAFGASWSQVHPLCPEPGSKSDDPAYNPVGEDFLYMHRQMIGHLRAALAEKGLPCITGFQHPPAPEEWPMPGDSTEGAKSPQALTQFQEWDRVFRDRAWLSTVSLSQLGWSLEFSIHNNLHMRFSTDKPPRGFNGVAKTGGAPIPFNGKFPNTWSYDSPGYDWLADPYGAAVNPTFWKIHGYVDHMIDLWLDAHGYQAIAENCEGHARCYEWKGTWLGSVPAENSLPRATMPGSPDSGAPIDPTVFNQKRMRLQRIGVLTSRDLLPRASVPRDSDRAGFDPVAFVNQKLCTSH